MKKLISKKNLISKYKFGNMIIKAEDGYRLVNGRAKYYDEATRELYPDFLKNPKFKTLTHRYRIGDMEIGSFDGGKSYYELSTGKPFSYRANLKLISRINARNAGTTRSRKPASSTNWDNKWNTFLSTLTDEDKKLITDNGGSYNSAKELLQFLENQGHSGTGLDNKWGDNSLMAFDAWKSSLNSRTVEPAFKPIDMSNIKLPNFAIRQPAQLTAPNYGYRTDFDYTGSNKAIREFGFNNYVGLQNFVRANGDNLFAKDLVQRFGNVDKWDLNAVENELGVSGTYGRGRYGDYSDIMNSMASWAGRTNAIYDANKRGAEYKAANRRWAKSFIDRLPTPNFSNKTNTSVLPTLYETSTSNSSYTIPTFSTSFKDMFKLENGGNLISRDPVKRFKERMEGGDQRFLERRNSNLIKN